MTVYLIGANGRLGQAIASEYAGEDIVPLDRRLYEPWSRVDGADAVSRFFDPLAAENAMVFVASGLLDPRSPPEDLLAVNYQLPRSLIDGAARLGIKVVTFGTVMEGALHTKNAYIQSKAALSNHVSAVAARGTPVVHLQMHTLYGRGRPSPFMFLGQMLAALRANEPFRMTSGRQLREYHHLADEAKAIRRIARSTRPGVVNLSHGVPLELRAIAESVFLALGKRSLLRIGALPEPPDEIYERVLPPTEMVRQVHFRDSLPAIIEYMRECHAGEEVPA
jgi:nucleoside-diphosphate-sugar epimerase